MKWPWRKKELPQPHQPAPEPRAPAAETEALAQLTPREQQVFNALMQGYKLREIADLLDIKYSTVNTHYKSVYKKLGVNSRAECFIRYSDAMGAMAAEGDIDQ